MKLLARYLKTFCLAVEWNRQDELCQTLLDGAAGEHASARLDFLGHGQQFGSVAIQNRADD